MEHTDMDVTNEEQGSPSVAAMDQAEVHVLIRDSFDRYGTAEVNAFGTDISMLRQNLRLTPTERLRKMVTFVQFVQKAQGTRRTPER